MDDQSTQPFSFAFLTFPFCLIVSQHGSSAFLNWLPCGPPISWTTFLLTFYVFLLLKMTFLDHLPELASMWTTNLVDHFSFSSFFSLHISLFQHISSDRLNWVPYGPAVNLTTFLPALYVLLFHNFFFLLDWIGCIHSQVP